MVVPHPMGRQYARVQISGSKKWGGAARGGDSTAPGPETGGSGRLNSNVAKRPFASLRVDALGASILVVGFLAAVHQGAGEDAGILADLLLDGLGDLGMFLEIGLGVLTALADALAVIGEPRA